MMTPIQYNEDPQDIQVRPNLSLETIPEIPAYAAASPEASPVLPPPPSCMSPHPVKHRPRNIPEKPSERMEQHIQDVVELGEYNEKKRGKKRVHVCLTL
jgi:hypothetical protein